jgi:hypothetical protein
LDFIVARKYTGEAISVFNFRAFINLLKGQLRNGTFLKYLYGVSPLYRIVATARDKMKSFSGNISD